MCIKCPVVYLLFCKKFSSNVNISRKFVIPLCDNVQSWEPCFPLFGSDDNCYNQISMKVTLCKMTGCPSPVRKQVVKRQLEQGDSGFSRISLVLLRFQRLGIESNYVN